MRFKWAEKGKTVSPLQIVLVFDMFVFLFSCYFIMNSTLGVLEELHH
jgi:hypothetical protein